MSIKTKQLPLSALFNRLSLDPEKYSSDIGESDDIKTLYSTVFKPPPNQEVLKWVEFADKFPVDSKGCFDALSGLNDDLLTKSVLLGNGTTPSEADVIVFAAIHASVIDLSQQDREKLPHLLRWIDYIQHKKDFAQLFEKIVFEKPSFQHQVPSVNVAPKQEDSKAKKASQNTYIAEKASQNTKIAEKTVADKDTKKTDTVKKATGTKESTQEKKKTQETKASGTGKDEVSVSLLNIQVGLIRKAWKHPSADSLLVEEIDVGEAKVRQVVSGLAKFCTTDELTNRRVVLITNVKPGKLRDVMSEGLVLCASNEDHTAVEPLLPPEGAKIGERVLFVGVDGKPEDVLNPKKKQLEKITPHLFTDEEGVATFKGIPFMTSGGPCKSSIPKATIK